MANHIDRHERYFQLIEKVLAEHPRTIDNLTPSRRAELETVAAQRRLTPEAVLVLGDTEVLASIKAEREARAVALEIRAAS